MEQKTLTIQLKEKSGKNEAKRIRRKGGIPAVVYGEMNPLSIIVDQKEFNKKFHTVSENTIIQLKGDSETIDVLVKDYQEDILSGKITHLDFYRVVKGKQLRTFVPIHLEGSPKGVREGGIMEYMLHTLEVECLPKDIPASITVDVNSLELGASIHVGSITPPEGVKILNQPDQVVVVITHHAKAEVEDEAAEAEVETMEEEEKTV